MKKEWLSILWILAIIFGIVGAVATWNRQNLGFRRKKVRQEKEALCHRILRDAAKTVLPLTQDSCQALLGPIPLGTWKAFNKCMDETETLECVFSELCGSGSTDGCLLSARVRLNHPDTANKAISDLVDLCDRKNLQACAILQDEAESRPGLDSPSTWHMRICRLSGRHCSRMDARALQDCLRNPVGRCLSELLVDPDPVGMFLACEAGSGFFCRRWLTKLFPHLEDPEDPHWSGTLLEQLCMKQDSASCLAVGLRENTPSLVTHACVLGEPDACSHLLETETEPVRRKFLEQRMTNSGIISPGSTGWKD